MKKVNDRIKARGASRIDNRKAARERLEQSPQLKKSIAEAQRKQTARRGGRTFLREMFGIDFDDLDPRYGNYYNEYRPPEVSSQEDDADEIVAGRQVGVGGSIQKDDAISVSKKELSKLSDSFVDLLNSFSKLTASQVYMGEVKRALSEAAARQQKEAALETPRPLSAPSSTIASEGGQGSDIDPGMFKDLTDEIEGLSKAIEDNPVGTTFGTGSKPGTAPVSSKGIGTAAVVGAGVVGATGLAMAAPKVTATEPELPRDLDKPTLTSNQKARASRYTEKLSSSIDTGVRSASAPVGGGYYGGQDQQGAVGDGGYQDYGSTDGSGSGAINPPTSGMAGAIYQTAKQRGYDDHMAIAFVSVAEKESGLKPQAENMNYKPERAREIFGAAAVPYTGNPRRFANYVYGPATRKGKQLGNTGPEDGWNYRGKGFIQVTGKNNYRALSRVVGYDLVKDPDALINNPEIAIKGLFGFYETPSLGGSVVKGKKTARSQSEANRILTDATGGRVGFSSGSAFGRQNLAKVDSFSAKYTAGGLASSTNTQAAAGSTRTGAAIINPDNVRETIRGKKIWDYARKNGSDIDWDGLKQGMKDRFLAMAIEYKEKTGNKVAINSANRTYAKQAELFRRYGARRAAPPGRSKHESGVAIDINSPDAEKMIQLGLFEKYGFYRPYAPAETWHIEPKEASRVKGQSDNPYQPGAAITQTGRGGKPVIQDARGGTKPVTDPKRDVGAPTTAAAITKKVGDKDCPVMVQVVSAGGGAAGPGPGQYLAGVKGPRQAKPIARNPAKEYKMYFAA